VCPFAIVAAGNSNDQPPRKEQSNRHGAADEHDLSGSTGETRRFVRGKARQLQCKQNNDNDHAVAAE
jgi:penicillin V acylase-like amidase (Ntn superfamily)